jgi:group I intron endonuclease
MGRKIKDGALFYIYEVKNNINGKTYIGQRHYFNKIKDYYYGSGVLIMKALKKYGKTNFTKTIIISGIESKNKANELEIYYIAKHKEIGKAEYNISTGGEGSTGFHHTMENKLKYSIDRRGYVWSKESREKLSKSIKGHPVSLEQREKISKANKGRPNNRKGIPLSQEHKDKIGKAHKGMKHTKETKDYISKIQMGKRMGKDNGHSKPVKCIETGEGFDCATDAVRKYGPHNLGYSGITRCCRGNRKTAYGMHWEYAN